MTYTKTDFVVLVILGSFLAVATGILAILIVFWVIGYILCMKTNSRQTNRNTKCGLYDMEEIPPHMSRVELIARLDELQHILGQYDHQHDCPAIDAAEHRLRLLREELRDQIHADRTVSTGTPSPDYRPYDIGRGN